MSHTLLLIDAYSQIYRAFYAIRELSSPTGKPVNAIFGFTKMTRKLIADHRPTHLAVVYDLGAPATRLALLPGYKANRPPTPPLLDQQLPGIREVLIAQGLPIIEQEGEEADDLIATLAIRAAAAETRVLIASNDKDLCQLVSDRIAVLRPDTKQTIVVDPAGVRERYGVTPAQMVDYLSLTGDAVDEIPGVPGIGEKTAVTLLQQFGDLETMLARVDEVAKPRLREILKQHSDRARQNRELIRLRQDLPLAVDWQTLAPATPDLLRLRELYREFGFKTLLAELEQPAAAPKPANMTGDLFGR